jgi:FkbM family methyltransferase
MGVMANLRQQIAGEVKEILYGRRGEPYRFAGQVLRYVPGTRPIRLHYLNSRNSVNRYDALQVTWLDSHLKEGDSAIDVGAHYGVYSILMAAKCGQNGHVVAFEPDPYAREVLARNVSLNPGLRPPVIESAACFDEIGNAVLFTRGGNAQSSLVRSGVQFSDTHKSEEIAVATVTPNSYLAAYHLAPSCVKIDAEGAEIRILKSATSLLAGNAKIICELHPYAWREFGNRLAELKDLATTAGRCIRYLDQDAQIGHQVEYGTVVLECCS